MKFEDLEAEALKLDSKSRARLAKHLLKSLDNLAPDEVDEMWAEEAQRRADAQDAGTLSARPAADVFRDARARM
jgi:Putative addiction module component